MILREVLIGQSIQAPPKTHHETLTFQSPQIIEWNAEVLEVPRAHHARIAQQIQGLLDLGIFHNSTPLAI